MSPLGQAGRLRRRARARLRAAPRFAGSRIDVHPGKPAAEPDGMGGMDAEAGGHGAEAMAPQTVRGLAVSDEGLTLELARRTRAAGQAVRRSPSGSSTATAGPCATSTSSTPSACTSSSCAAT